MIDYIKGTVAELTPTRVILDNNGIGYRIEISLQTYEALEGKTEAKVYIYHYFRQREDIEMYYGFATRDELRCFQQLVAVSGVGPKAALAILSVTTPDSFRLAVLTGDEKTITAAPGVGKKLAQRILLELKDKIAGEQTEFSGVSGGPIPIPTGSRTDEALAALQALGYSASESAAALRGADENASVEELVRYALRAMVLR